jgi:hypothetical protein
VAGRGVARARVAEPDDENAPARLALIVAIGPAAKE